MTFTVIEIKKTKATDIVFPSDEAEQDLVTVDSSYIRIPTEALPGEAKRLFQQVIMRYTWDYPEVRGQM